MVKSYKKTDECAEHSCKRTDSLKQCQFCQRMFCTQHIQARPSKLADFESSKYNDYKDRWDIENSHPDFAYATYLEKHEEGEKQMYRDALNSILKPFNRPTGSRHNISEPHFVKRTKNNMPVVILTLGLILLWVSSQAQINLAGIGVYLWYLIYLGAAALAVSINLKIYRHTSRLRMRSDSDLFIANIRAGVYAVIAAILIVWGLSSVTLSKGNFDVAISIFMIILGIGIAISTRFLIFRHKRGSGFIVYKGD